MPSYLILTAVTMEARAIRRAGLAATVIGIGATRLSAVVVPPGTTAVFMAGVGGGIDPSLAVGDVVTDGTPVAGVRCGVIHSVDRVVSTVAEKTALFAATGAAVVDMEQATVRAWADRLGLPVVGVRAVSDAATDVIDPAVVRFVTDVGRPRPGVIAGALLRRPRLMPHLMQLNRDTKLALSRLGPAVRAVLDGRAPAGLPASAGSPASPCNPPHVE